jgi:hypothetical protein
VIASDWTQFASTSHQHPIDLTQTGALVSNVEVWTGSGGTGVGGGGCSEWTSADPAASFPAVGLTSRADSGWSNVYLQLCDRAARLYCVQQ